MNKQWQCFGKIYGWCALVLFCGVRYGIEIELCFIFVMWTVVIVDGHIVDRSLGADVLLNVFKDIIVKYRLMYGSQFAFKMVYDFDDNVSIYGFISVPYDIWQYISVTGLDEFLYPARVGNWEDETVSVLRKSESFPGVWIDIFALPRLASEVKLLPLNILANVA
jgi:hypothetical protein